MNRRRRVERRYQVVGPLAAGGMGRVDLVLRRDGAFVRLFAQKRLRPELLDDPAVRRMFLDEGRIAGLVRHPQVVSVVDVGEDDDGPFLVMELVEGLSLAQLISRAAARGEQVPMGVALRIAVQVAEGLHAVHETRGPDGELLQLIHRDVSPQNVLIAFDGTARVSDFGIAKGLGRATRTTTGILKGKLGYLAPERLRFEEPDRRADLFSFGVVLFELLAARRLYDSDNEVHGARRILDEPPPDLADERADVEPELVELLFQLLAKDRACRPADAGVVARRLEQILATVLASGGVADAGAYVLRLFEGERAALRAKVAQAALSAAPTRAQRPAALASPAGRLGWAAALVVAAGLGTAATLHATRRGQAAPTVVLPSPIGDVLASSVRAPLATAPPARATEPAARPLRRSRQPGRVGSRRTPVADACTPPYTVDASGERQFKLRCLIDVRH